MKIRLMGTENECAQAAERLRGCFEVIEESSPQPNRGDSGLVRVYVEVRLLRAPRVRERPVAQ